MQQTFFVAWNSGKRSHCNFYRLSVIWRNVKMGGRGEKRKKRENKKSFKNCLRLYLQPGLDLMSIFSSYFVLQPLELLHVEYFPFLETSSYAFKYQVVPDHPNPPSSKYHNLHEESLLNLTFHIFKSIHEREVNVSCWTNKIPTFTCKRTCPE